MKSKTNNRSWTTVAIGREQYSRLKKAASLKRMKLKWIANDVIDAWATSVISCHSLPDSASFDASRHTPNDETESSSDLKAESGNL